MTIKEKLREDRVKKKGLSLVRKGEANLERQLGESFKEVEDAKTGKKTLLRSTVAERLVKRGKYTNAKKVFGIPNIPGFTS